jgi:hypothetical protein
MHSVAHSEDVDEDEDDNLPVQHTAKRPLSPEVFIQRRVKQKKGAAGILTLTRQTKVDEIVDLDTAPSFWPVSYDCTLAYRLIYVEDKRDAGGHVMTHDAYLRAVVCPVYQCVQCSPAHSPLTVPGLMERVNGFAQGRCACQAPSGPH